MDLQKNLTYNLHKLIWDMDNEANRMLKAKFDITFSKFYVMVVLASLQPTTQARLASTLGQSTAAVSNSLGILEKEKFVTIVANPSHRRKNQVTLTKSGQKIVEAASSYLEEEFTSAIASAGIDITRYALDTHKLSVAFDKIDCSKND
jgi:DNA-binding MarR family transcriptional regulator